MIGHKQCGGLEVQCQLEFNCSKRKYKWNSWKNYWRARFGFRTVLKILRNGSFRSHWKHDQRKQKVSLCLILIYRRFSVQFVTTTSQFALSESNGLVYKPHPRFLAQNLSKKVRLIHKSLRYFTVIHKWSTTVNTRSNDRCTQNQISHKLEFLRNFYLSILLVLIPSEISGLKWWIKRLPNWRLFGMSLNTIIVCIEKKLQLTA